MPKKKSFLSKITTYLIEIIIIIIGITISFALNEWSKHNGELKDYQKYLENLQQDIKIDSVQMVNDIQSYSRISKGTEVILRYDDKYRKDSLLDFALSVDKLSNYIEFLPNNNTFEMLSSTGGFKVFENKELVKEIIQLYQYDYAFIRMMGGEAQNERRNSLEPYLLQHIYFEDRETFPNIKTDIVRLINDPYFRNLCYSYGNSSWSAINAYRRAMKRLRKVDEMLQEELDKL